MFRLSMGTLRGVKRQDEVACLVLGKGVYGDQSRGVSVVHRDR